MGPADGPEPQSTRAAAPNSPRLHNAGPAHIPAHCPPAARRAREGCRACLARPDASQRALSFAVRTVSFRCGSREREARTCAAAIASSSSYRSHACMQTWRPPVQTVSCRMGSYGGRQGCSPHRRRSSNEKRWSRARVSATAHANEELIARTPGIRRRRPGKGGVHGWCGLCADAGYAAGQAATRTTDYLFGNASTAATHAHTPPFATTPSSTRANHRTCRPRSASTRASTHLGVLGAGT